MSNDGKAETKSQKLTFGGFLAELLTSLVRDIVKFIIAFAVGTGAAAIACWYYDLPLVLSLIGGFIVLGLALALSTDSLFS